jgi:membrane protease YdiL (CAAX protease family)
LDLGTAPDSRGERVWRGYILIIGVILGSWISVNLTRIVASSSDDRLVSHYESIRQGDLLVRYALALRGHNPRSHVRAAIEAYQSALPSPEAYRRIGVLKEFFLNESGRSELLRVDNAEALKDLSASAGRKLRAEAAIWRDILDDKHLAPSRVRSYAKAIRFLDLGPLSECALSILYRHADLVTEAKSAALAARRAATIWAMKMAVTIGVVTLAGVAGVVAIVQFLTTQRVRFALAIRPRIQPSVLFISFIVCVVSLAVLGVCFDAIGYLFGIDSGSQAGACIILGLNALAMLGSLALGVSTLRTMTRITGEDMAEAGFRPMSFRCAVFSGVVAYCATVLPVVVMLGVSYVLSNTLFRGVETPPHPLEETVAQGGAAYLIAFVMAVVVAPVVEETVFRGFFYTALRTRTRPWAASLVSAAVFAAVHPTLPGQFLPIFALGVVLAITRERTGSLLPSIICHGLHNAVVVVIAGLVS